MRRSVISALAIGCAGLLLPLTAAPAAPTTGDPSQSSSAVDKQDPPGKRTGLDRRGKDLKVTVSELNSDGTVAVTVHGEPERHTEVDVIPGRAMTTATSSLSLTTDVDGDATGRVKASVASTGVGTLRLVARQPGSTTGRTATGTEVLWATRTTSGEVLSSSDSEWALRAERIAAEEPSLTDTVVGERAMTELAAAGAEVTGTVTAAAAGDTVVHGRVRYRDAAWRAHSDDSAHLHPARRATVIALDLSNAMELGRTTVNDFGFYTLTLGTNPSNVIVRVQAQSEWAEVGTEGFLTWSGPYFVQTIRENVASGSSVNADFEIANRGTAGTAFAVLDAMTTSGKYAERVRGRDIGDIQVDYPDNNGSRYGSGQMHLTDDDWADWDVITHEYGHYVDDEIDASNLPGGAHCLDDNLWVEACEFLHGDNVDGYGKEHGTELAWSEGWATFFGQSAQTEMNDVDATTPQIPEYADVLTGNGVGDAVYRDADLSSDLDEIGTGFSYDLENLDSTARHGEDNEIAVSSAMWDVYDSAADGMDSTSMSDFQLFDIVDDNNPARFSDVVQHLLPTGSTRPLTASGEQSFACTLSESRIAPYWGTESAPNTGLSASASLSQPPTLDWSAGNEAVRNHASTTPLHQNTRFRVEAVDTSTNTAYFTSPEVTDSRWTPSRAQWDTMSRGRGAAISVRVVGWQDDGPATGPFFGCAKSLELTATAIDNSTECAAVALPRNDDGSTGAVNLPFPVNFFGTGYTYLYVNNNGNVTFRNPMSTYTPFAITGSSPPIIAPFFADIDTRGSGSAPVTYSYGTTTYNGRPAFCVNWLNVGYYAGHTDKLVSAQLLLVDRSPRGSGDFDIIFNYDSVQWETGDASGGSGGLGGTPASAGFSAGTGVAGEFFQLPGSLTSGALIDGGGHSLAGHSTNSLQRGRHVYEVRNGLPPTGTAVIRGHVGTDTPADVWSVSDAPVQVCPSAGGQCAYLTRSDDSGAYFASGLRPGTYDVTAFPPAGTNASRTTVRNVTVAAGENRTVDLVLDEIDGPADGTTVTPSRGDLGGIPVVHWQDGLRFAQQACAGGVASYEILNSSFRTIASGSMTEGAAGAYSANVPPLYPEHGYAHVIIVVVCPDGTPTFSTGFDIYIDPSGIVRTTTGQPIEGAAVTLLRSDSPTGPFTAVPDGSDVMSPANRTNPMTTDGAGHFGWDVLSGYYVVEARKDGCWAPGEPSNGTVRSRVMEIPPPVTDLEIVFECADATPPAVTITSVSDSVVNASTASSRVSFVSDRAGAYRVSVGGSDCTDGTAAGTGAAPAGGIVAVDIPIDLLLEGSNVVRVCVTASMRTGSATAEIVKDSVAPTLTLTSVPPATTLASSASVAFTVDGATEVTCALDRVAYEPCASPVALSALSAGPHSFAVRARDAAGNEIIRTSDWTVQAKTSLSFVGDEIQSVGQPLRMRARLSSSAASCVSGRPVQFELDRSPIPGSAGAYPVGGARTGADGTAAVIVATTGWTEGVYQVTATSAGDDVCLGSTDTATLTIAAPGAAATGGGWYTVPGVGRVSTGFTVRHTKVGTYKGEFQLVNDGNWRLKGDLTSYVMTGTAGAASGTGELYWWNPALQNGTGDWELAAQVPFTISFTDAGPGARTADTFGIRVGYVPTGSQPSSLPNSSPAPLQGGNVALS